MINFIQVCDEEDRRYMMLSELLPCEMMQNYEASVCFFRGGGPDVVGMF